MKKGNWKEHVEKSTMTPNEQVVYLNPFFKVTFTLTTIFKWKYSKFTLFARDCHM
jgi:hypothetical protein